ncbi:MAG: PD-(D/E)XK nuclease family protein [Muribaculaceae bacterium]|nr:PD-(D/E)XK nuclease family protein [Muribaculaceae bacterium]
MNSENFLRSVAAYYAENVAGRPAPENIVYILPNKRSAMFLKKYVREYVEGIAVMPRFMTMRSFISIFSQYPEASQRELLFILYDAYRKVLQTKNQNDSISDFDSFIFWGDMMLSDFDEIDTSLVNASALFKNLKDLKQIQANYLDEHQKEVIRRVWGESRLTADIDIFWEHLKPNDGSEGEMASKFIYLWEILGDVYREFHSILTDKKLSSIGSQYRSALDAIKGLDINEIDDSVHYAFVGFNDLTVVETLIFDHLKTMNVASFFWDTAAMSLFNISEKTALPKPIKRMRELLRHFPMPDDYVAPSPQTLPQITVTACPSDVGQAKAINSVLSQWINGEFIDVNNPLNTAIVLPDQNLLLPTLLSIPDDIEKINITMGLPYRTTTFATLLHAIISMQLRARKIHGSIHFFYEDVNAVLVHPHIQFIAASAADKISRQISDNKLYNISTDELLSVAPVLAPIFAPVADNSSVSEVASYLTGLLDFLYEQLSGDAEKQSSTPKFEIKAIKYFREEVEDISQLVKEYGIDMNERTFFLLFEKIFNSRALSVNGTPLQGLQVLGVLETRALDFDNVIILSMNERIFPRRQYSKTMIPGNLRSGFGLPDFESLEWTYAYCFYRLIARAKRVELFYDSRDDGQGYGEVSRYVSQMHYLMPNVKVVMQALTYSSTPDTYRSIEIEKTSEVMKYINQFRAGGNLRLSASALKTYKKCPMKFYLEYARRMRGSDELVDYISSAEFGTIVHNVIQQLYSGYKKQLITSDLINRWLDASNPIIDNVAREQVIKERYPKVKDVSQVTLLAEAQLACRLVASIARADLAAEAKLYCSNGSAFTFIENEYKVNDVWHIDNGLDVNFYMSIDRVDSIDAKKLRFIDFKTGNDNYCVKSVPELFNSDADDTDGIFQLFTYCEAYNSIVNDNVELQPVLHPMRKLSAGDDLSPIMVDEDSVMAYSEYRELFQPLLRDFIKEIFDDKVKIRQCDKIENCTYCHFQTLCGRIQNKN